MLSNSLVWSGTLLIVVGAAAYIRDMFRGQTRPDLTTWLLWSVAPLIIFVAQLHHGVGSPALLTLAMSLCPAAVFVAGLRKAHFRVTRFSLLCGGLSVGALASWQATGSGKLAIALSIVSDMLAALPTLVKSYRYPQSENPLFFALFMAGAGITLLTIPHWTVESSAFAIYVFVLYALLFTFAQSRIGERGRSRLSTGNASAPARSGPQPPEGVGTSRR